MVKKAKPKNKGGRPTKYDPKYNELAYNAIKEIGLKDKEVATILGITEGTFYNWQKGYPEFLQSIKKAKDDFDTKRVEIALRDRALGYSHPDTHFATSGGKIISQEYIKHYAPDVGALTLWLCNRNPARWRSVNNTIIKQGLDGQDAEEYFKEIASEIKKADTDTD